MRVRFRFFLMSCVLIVVSTAGVSTAQDLEKARAACYSSDAAGHYDDAARACVAYGTALNRQFKRAISDRWTDEWADADIVWQMYRVSLILGEVYRRLGESGIAREQAAHSWDLAMTYGLVVRHRPPLWYACAVRPAGVAWRTHDDSLVELEKEVTIIYEALYGFQGGRFSTDGDLLETHIEPSEINWGDRP